MCTIWRLVRRAFFAAVLFGFFRSPLHAGCLSVANGAVSIEETTAIIGAHQVFCQLIAAKRSPSSPESTLKMVSLRQIVSLRVITASLELNYTIGLITNEIEELKDAQTEIAGRRDRSLALMNLSNILVGTGVGAVGQGLAISGGTAEAGNIVAASAGAVATGLSLASREVKESAAGPPEQSPAMLAQVLGYTPNERSTYPRSVWLLLSIDEPGSQPPVSRRIALLHEWSRLGWMKPEDREALITVGPTNIQLTIDEIKQRISMLADVRSEIAQFNLGLAQLTTYIAGVGRSS
jgi:hypothetical protein